MRDLCAAQRDVQAVNVADTRTAFLYNKFRELCATLKIKHWIDEPALPVADILQVYGYWVRHGHCSNLHEVRVDSVYVVW